MNLFAKGDGFAIQYKKKLSPHVETVVLLSKGIIDSQKVKVEMSLEDMDMSGFQKGATYEAIKNYVKEKPIEDALRHFQMIEEYKCQ